MNKKISWKEVESEFKRRRIRKRRKDRKLNKNGRIKKERGEEQI